MLKQEATTGYSHHQTYAEPFDDSEIRENPFPGLRPFQLEESHLFFGRESHVDEILLKLSQNRFITVMGYSGSGKSSIMHCGLVPVLYGGFVTEVGANWKIITTRPGSDPFYNLSLSILKNKDDYHSLDDGEKEIYLTIINSVLKSGSTGFVEAIRQLHYRTGQNIFLLLDQFEEIFRYSDEIGNDEDAAAFVQMILEAVRQTEVPIYVAITMRSDFIGRCANFPGLTDKINESNYLVPQLSREMQRLVIEGPVAVGGGKISDRLVKKLLNDISDHQDQLPILQHVLMRSWNYWLENRDSGEPLDVRHYNAVGGISEALSQHADEAYDELDMRQKEIAEVIFKTLTLKTQDGQGIRQVAKVSLIAEIANANEEEVIEVVEEFRKPGRSFLMPAPGTELTGETYIEISHESLMRIWSRLKAWVDEEFESAQMYKRLSEASAMYQIGKTGLWRPPDLQLALNWQKKQKPNRAWARRYDEAFERAMVFLETSRITYEAEQKNQEMVQKRLLRRTRAVAIVLGVATVVVILFGVFAFMKQVEAAKERDRYLAEKNIVSTQKDKIQEAAMELELQKQDLQEQKNKLQMAYDSLQLQKAVIMDQRDAQRILIADLEVANRKAEENFREAEKQRLAAETNEEAAREQYYRAQSLFELSVAQSMAIKSQFIEDNTDRRILVATQAYNFHANNNGRDNDRYIYDALHDALDEYGGGAYNSTFVSEDALRSVIYEDNFIYVAGSDGSVWKINEVDGEDRTLLLSNDWPARFIRMSPDKSTLLVATDSAYLQVVNLSSGEVSTFDAGDSFMKDIKFVKNSPIFYSIDANQQLRINDLRNGSSVLFKQLENPLQSLAVHPSGKKLAIGTEDSKVILIDIPTKEASSLITKGKNNPAHSVVFSPQGNYLAVGYEKGSVQIFEVTTGTSLKELFGHSSKVSKVEFSPDGRYLASASFDRSVYLYSMNELEELPLILDDHKTYVWDIDFDPNKEYLIAATGSGELKKWPMNASIMGNKMCQLIFRNLTPEEWRDYAGSRIQYEKSCENLPDF